MLVQIRDRQACKSIATAVNSIGKVVSNCSIITSTKAGIYKMAEDGKLSILIVSDLVPPPDWLENLIKALALCNEVLIIRLKCKELKMYKAYNGLTIHRHIHYQSTVQLILDLSGIEKEPFLDLWGC